MFWPCETRTSICRNLATISSGLYRFLAITVLLDVKDIPQVGPLQWGWIQDSCLQPLIDHPSDHAIRYSLVEKRSQLGVRNRVKVLAYIDVQHPVLSSPRDGAVQLAQRHVCRASPPKTI